LIFHDYLHNKTENISISIYI